MALSFVIGIDASNLLQGGGVTHLIELLKAADPAAHGVKRVVIWGRREILAKSDDRDWLEKLSPPELEGNLLKRTLWQRRDLTSAARFAGCDILFVPGGSFLGNFQPVVTMSRNMLPFDLRELLRYGFSILTLRLMLLRFIQSSSLRRADGVIFLNQAAKKAVISVTGPLTAECVVVPHGLNSRFLLKPREQYPINLYSSQNPYSVIYVSIVDQYKHQWHVVEAISELRQTGLPVVLDLIGPAYPPAFAKLKAAIARYDPDGRWVRYHGAVPYAELHDLYANADLGLFASTCENMPNILLETMASGLPVVCSNRDPMHEVLGDAGVYFDSERPNDIARALRILINSPTLRSDKASASYKAALSFNWKRCADDTLGFLVRLAANHQKDSTKCVEY